MAKSPSKSDVATAAADTVVELTAEEIMEAAEAAKAEELRQEHLTDFGGELKDSLDTLTNLDSSSAIEARLQWVKIGNLLNEGEALFMSAESNKLSDKLYGQWLKAEGHTQLGSRATRAAAKWLATVHDTNPDMYALFPTVSENGVPLRRSPQTLQSWIREQAYASFNAAFQSAGEDEAGIDAVSHMEDKNDKQKAAKAGMPNVLDVLDSTVAKAEGVYSAALEVCQANADPKNKIKASVQKTDTAILAVASSELDKLHLSRDILKAMDADARVSLFMGWKPTIPAIPFAELTVAEAARKVFETLVSKYHKPQALVDALGVLVAEAAAKVAADDAAAAGEVVDDETGDVVDENDNIVETEDDDGDFDFEVE